MRTDGQQEGRKTLLLQSLHRHIFAQPGIERKLNTQILQHGDFPINDLARQPITWDPK